MSSSAVELRNVSRSFGSHHVLTGLELVVDTGSVVALMGANGAGKSTLMDLVCGLTQPDTGTVRVLGQSPVRAVRSGRVGAMLQSGGLLEDLTVRETLALFVELFGNRASANELLVQVGLDGIKDRRVRHCSGGERQRLRWAVALCPRPQLLVLDEPTAGMDWLVRRDFWQQVRRATQSGATVLYSSHYADEVEQADRLVLLSGGRLVVDAAPHRVAASAPDGRTLLDGLAVLLEQS